MTFSESKPTSAAEHEEVSPEILSGAERLLRMSHEQDREADIVEIPDARVFRQAVVFVKRAATTEPTVRLFRGIASVESALRQEPFAMRTRKEESDKELSFLEHARPEVDALAEHPTAERLYAYVDAVWPDLNDAEVRDFQRSLTEIEDSVIEHHVRLRWSLMFEQYKFGSSPRPDSGIAPYMPGSRLRKTAKAYGRAAVMVLDLPLSAFETPNEEGDEVHIKGAIKPEHVTAVIIKERFGGLRDEEMNAEFDALLGKLPAASTSEAEETALLREKIFHTRKVDEAQWERDAEVIRQRRTARVLSKFAEMGIRFDDALGHAKEWETDVYTAAKRLVYDALEKRYEATGRSREDLSDATYQPEYGNSAHFSREAVDDRMLVALRKLVRYMEQWQRDNDAYRRQREEIRRLTG